MSDTLTQSLEIRVVAATQPAEASLAKLQGTVGQLGDKLDKLSDSFGSTFDSISVGIEKVKLGFEAFNEVFDLGEKALDLAKFSAEMKNFEAHLPVGALNEMTRATEGTVAQLDLMRFGMRALQGDVHVTEDGLGDLLGAARKLADEGFGDVMVIAEELEHSLRTGTTKELKNLGITLDDTHDKAELLRETMVKLVEIEFSNFTVDPALKELERLDATTKNWINDMKVGLGDAVTSAIGLFDTLSDRLAGIEHPNREAQIKQLAKDELERQHGTATTQTWGNVSVKNSAIDTGNEYADYLLKSQLATQFSGDLAALEAKYRSRFAVGDSQELLDTQVEYVKKLSAANAGRLATRPTSDDEPWAWWLQPGKAPSARSGGGGRSAPEFDYMKAIDALLAPDDKRLAQLDAGATGLQYHSADTSEILDGFIKWQLARIGPDTVVGTGSKIAGGLADYNAKQLGDKSSVNGLSEELKDKTNPLGMAFSTLDSGVTAGIEAAITGADSVGKAWQKASAATLKGLAAESQGRALYYGMLGLGALVLSPGSAGGLFAAAAEAEAAALVCGALSASLGGGMSSASSGSSSGGGYGGSSGYASGPNTPPPTGMLALPASQQYQPNVTINVTGAMASDLPKLGELVNQAYQAVRVAGTGSSRSPSNTVTTFE